ncbi:MAG: cytochrome c oxidase subunit 3 [Hyphomicrobiales bacterium]
MDIYEFANQRISHHGFTINDSVYSSGFYFLTGLHFFHLVVGRLLLSQRPWSCCSSDLTRRLQDFYWHLLGILWLFIVLFLYSL